MKKFTVSVDRGVNKTLSSYAEKRSISLENAAVEVLTAGLSSLDFKAAEAGMQAYFDKRSKELVGDEARRKELFSCAVP